jgi:subtilisin family serine protease
MKYFFIVMIALFFISCGENQTVYYEDEEPIQIIDEFNISNGDGSYFYQQWYLKKDDTFYAQYGIDENAHIHITDEILNKYSGKGIRLAIIDDGFDINHPEIKDKVVASYAIDSKGNISSDVSQDRNEYHGTAVVGLISSSLKLKGVASDVELILIKMPIFLDDKIVEIMFDTAVEHGAQIINCSWGTNAVTPDMREYINRIAIESNDGQGVNIVFAAGNSNELMSKDESSIKEVIGVGALNHENLRATGYSNYGPQLDISAPGGDTIGLTTLDVTGIKGATDNNYSELNFIGTSASAPIVSGVIALLLESNSTLNKFDVEKKLYTHTDLIGENTPYIDDMISASTYPTISGLLGTSQNDEFYIRLTDYNTLLKYDNEITTINGDNTFNSIFSQEIPNGSYKVELVSNSGLIFATDLNFTINNENVGTLVDINKKHSDFYGSGKINVSKVLNEKK